MSVGKGHIVSRNWGWLLLLTVLWMPGCGATEPELGDATEHFLAAQAALDRGDNATALEELNKSIELGPDPWAYYQRARLLNDQKQTDKALADCKAGLALDPQHGELKWLAGELQKPADQRFVGKNAKPPNAGK